MLHMHKSQQKFQKNLIFLVLGLLFSFLLGASNVGQPKVYRVGVLSGLDFFAGAVDGFKSQMTELGYIEGENITYDVQNATIDLAAYETILKQFVADDVDLIFVFPTEASILAKQITEGTDIPIIFALAFVEGVNLVDTLEAPGGNITGVRFPGAEVATKRLEILLQLAPEVKNIWVPYLRDYPSVPAQLEAIRLMSAPLGINVIEFATSSPAELQAELDTRAASENVGLDAILLIAEPVAATPDFFGIIAQFAYTHQVPFGGSYMLLDGYGSIFGLNPDAVSAGEQVAYLADKILQGTPAGTIPVLTADNSLLLNDTVAKSFGITIPEGLLKQADEVIR